MYNVKCDNFSIMLFQFGISAMTTMFEQAEQLCTTDDSLPSEWSAFVITIAEIIDSVSCATSCQPIATNMLNKYLNPDPDPQLDFQKIERYTMLARLLINANLMLLDTKR